MRPPYGKHQCEEEPAGILSCLFPGTLLTLPQLQSRLRIWEYTWWKNEGVRDLKILPRTQMRWLNKTGRQVSGGKEGRICKKQNITQALRQFELYTVTYRQKHFNWHKYLTSERPGPTKYLISSTRITSSLKSSLTPAGRSFSPGPLNQHFTHLFLPTIVTMLLPVHCSPKPTE